MNFVHIFVNILPIILDITTAIVAIIVLIKFNTHTQKTEDVEMQHLYIDQLRNITNEAHELLIQIQETKILDIISLLEEKKYEKIIFDDIKKLRILIIKCDNSVDSIQNPTFDAGDYFDRDTDTLDKIDPVTALSEQRSILSDFIESSSKLIFEYGAYLSEDNNDKEEIINSIKALKGYLSFEENDSESSEVTPSGSTNDATESIEPPNMILMVAMRKALDSGSWSNQSLGDWRMAETKASKTQYILGVNVETRNIVSLTKVTSPENIKNNDKNYVRFKPFDPKEVYQQEKGKEENPITLPEATHWNPRNPIRYINRTNKELEDIKELLEKST